jgi:hypothetical protein
MRSKSSITKQRYRYTRSVLTAAYSRDEDKYDDRPNANAYNP